MTRISAKSLSIVLFALLFTLQFQLWCGSGGIQEIWRLRNSIADSHYENSRLVEQNSILSAEVVDLKAGDEAVAEHARQELGMIAHGETFYQLVE